jgi:hypothetical protein
MAFNMSPSALFPGYSSDGTDITIPIEDIVGLTSAEADEDTGDWRSIFLSLCATVFIHYNSLATADRPQAFVASPPTQYPVTSGALSGSFRQTYTFQFWNSFQTPDVVDEPA